MGKMIYFLISRLLLVMCVVPLCLAKFEEFYENEPWRDKRLEVNQQTPFNAEPPLDLLVENYITPNELHFKRSHMPIPDIDPILYQLSIFGLGIEAHNMSLDDIKDFPKHTVTASLQCAGNRREELKKIAPINGVTWRGGAIGNAQWSGASLREILTSIGFDPTNNPEVQHVVFEGLDTNPDTTDPSKLHYGSSIPIEKAMDPFGDVLLAYEMNGEPLPRDHGFPLRAIVPGHTGARNVKWLGSIELSSEESFSFWQRKDYKGFNPSITLDTADYSKAESIQEMPVTSHICSPSPGVLVEPGKVELEGFAWSGGGRKVIRVDITTDKGANWTQAELMDRDSSKHGRHWGWTLWKAVVDLPQDLNAVDDLEIWSKATDSSYNSQPESAVNLWNVRGVLNNAYSKLQVKLKSVAGSAKPELTFALPPPTLTGSSPSRAAAAVAVQRPSFNDESVMNSEAAKLTISFIVFAITTTIGSTMLLV